MLNLAHEELVSRCVKIGNVTGVFEFEQHLWCKEFKEIDGSFANGYSGLALVSIVNGWNIFDGIECNNRIDYRSDFGGFHMGRGLPIFIALKSGSFIIDNECHLKSLRNDVADKYDLYQGLAGDLLTASLLRRYIDDCNSELKEIENAKFNRLINYINNVQVNDIGYAHGALGMAYALLISNIKNKKADEFVEHTVLKGLQALEETGNYAVCSGPISSIVLSKIGAHLFDRRVQAESREICLDVLSKMEHFFENAPLNLCCGLFGIVDLMAKIASIDENKTIQARLLDLVSRINKSRYRDMMDTGLFFGVSGPAHTIEQIKNPASCGISLLFPS